MGGDIDFTSAAGEGSCFTFQVPLPRARGDRSGELGGAMEDLSRLRVLAADDNETNRIVVRTLLEGVGVSVDCAVDGDAAIAAWEFAPYDLILMDIHMPGRDGVAAAAEIRARERAAGRARTPIIALTASVLPGEQGRYAAAGMDGCIPKPVELARLIEALRSLSEAQPQAIARAV
jgi:two-component system, sensor histidine kinase